jgi:hypothetical protein
MRCKYTVNPVGDRETLCVFDHNLPLYSSSTLRGLYIGKSRQGGKYLKKVRMERVTMQKERKKDESKDKTNSKREL